MLKYMCVALFVCAVSTGAGAQEPSPTRPDDTRLLTAVTLEELEALVTGLGHEVEARGVRGDVSLHAVSESGLYYQLAGWACDTPELPDTGPIKCMGINMQVHYTIEGAVSLERVNEANLQFDAVSVWLSPPVLGVSRYVILDRGQTMGNLEENLIALLVTAPFIANLVLPPSEDATGLDNAPDTKEGQNP